MGTSSQLSQFNVNIAHIVKEHSCMVTTNLVMAINGHTCKKMVTMVISNNEDNHKWLKKTFKKIVRGLTLTPEMKHNLLRGRLGYQKKLQHRI